MSSRPGVFLFAIFISVTLSPSVCMFTWGPSSTFATLFQRCLSIRLFCYDFSVPIFCSKIFLPFLHSVVDMASPILLLSSQPGFHYLSVVLKGTPIFSQTNFAPAYIKSFNSVMSLVGIFVYKSFTFSISDFQSWFLREGNVIFFSDVNLLMVSISVFSSWISVCVCVFTVRVIVMLCLLINSSSSNFRIVSTNFRVLNTSVSQWILTELYAIASNSSLLDHYQHSGQC